MYIMTGMSAFNMTGDKQLIHGDGSSRSSSSRVSVCVDMAGGRGMGPVAHTSSYPPPPPTHTVILQSRQHGYPHITSRTAPEKRRTFEKYSQKSNLKIPRTQTW